MAFQPVGDDLCDLYAGGAFLGESAGGADVEKIAVITIGAIVILIVLFVWWRAKAKREKEKAEETERILNTPMQDLVNESKADELAKKYDEME